MGFIQGEGRTQATKPLKINRGVAEVSYRPTVGPGREAESRTALVALPHTQAPVTNWQASGGLSAYSGFPSDAQMKKEVEQDLQALAQGKVVVRDPTTYN